jgi:phosphoglycerate dehydrogenase-like enzyme
LDRKVICYLKPNTLEYYLTVPSEVLHHLAGRGFDFRYCETADDFLRWLPEAEIALVADFKAEWIRRAPKLKWVATYAAGKERVAEADLKKQGIKVSFGRFHGKIMAETVIGMMLFVVRGLGTAYRVQGKIEWCDRFLQDKLWTLRGKTCMILGFGQIGRHIAKLTKAFGMFNIGVKRTPDNDLTDVDQIITIQSFKDYLQFVDHLVIALPRDKSTNNLIGSQELALMKPTAALYNVGRGNCVDEEALYHALKNKWIHFACLDVFRTEPLPFDSPLRNLDNILILPHISAFAPEYFLLFFEEFLKDFERYYNDYQY